MSIRKYLSGAIVFSVCLLGICCTGEKGEEGAALDPLALHEEVLTVDTHCDTPMSMARDWDMGVRHEPGRRGGKIDLPRMKEGGLDAEFFAVFTGQGPLTEEGYARVREAADQAFLAIHGMCEDYPDLVELALTPDDAYRLEKRGKRAAFIGMENGYPIGRDLDMVKAYYDRGMRYLTLCHGGDNDICDSSTERENPEDLGLSEFGRRVVRECNRLGIMIDVSHMSDQSFFDVLALSSAPIFASHSSVRSICNHPRNLSDEMIKALAAKGGVVQICFVSGFLREEEPNPERNQAMAELRSKFEALRGTEDEEVREKMYAEYRAIMEKFPSRLATVEDLVDHVDHIVKLVGVDYVGLGTDFDGGGGIQGCNDVSEMPNITKELVKRGYSPEDIKKIWGGNVMRVFAAVIDAGEGDSPGEMN
jgi:membrane dipeptidase